MPRVELEEVTSPASAQSVAMTAVFPQNCATLTLLPRVVMGSSDHFTDSDL